MRLKTCLRSLIHHILTSEFIFISYFCWEKVGWQLCSSARRCVQGHADTLVTMMSGEQCCRLEKALKVWKLMLLFHPLKTLKCQISQSPWMHSSPVINTECDGLLLPSSNPSRQVCASCFFTVNWKEVKTLEGWKVKWDTFVFFSRLKHAKQLKWSLKKKYILQFTLLKMLCLIVYLYC